MEKNFINNIEIKNFKSIRHQKIEGCKRINVFIGYPNVGKSNILESISSASFLQFIDYKSKFSLTDLIRLESYSELFFEGNVQQKASVKINGGITFTFNYYKPSETIFWDVVVSQNNSTQLSYTLLFDKTLNVVEDSLRNLIKGISNGKILINKHGSSKYVAVPPKVLKYQFHQNISPDNDYKGWLAFPYGENLMQILSENVELRKHVLELFERYDLRLALDKASQSIKIVKENKDGTIFILPYSLIADTLQRLIFYQAAIYSNTDSVLLLEEPEAHMFPPYISKFTSDIWHKKDNQYFITTHSPFVLNDLLENAKDELAIYTVNLKDGETIIKKLSETEIHEAYQYGMDLFFNLESYIN